MRSWLTTVTNWDLTWFQSIFSGSESFRLSRFFHLISRSADGYLYPLVPITLFLFNHPSAFSYFLVAIVAFLIELPLYRLIKNGVKRTRPFKKLSGIKNRVIPPDEFSFPSGHTSAAFIMATITAFYFPWLAIPAYAWATLVGYSRVFLGVHFPSDVLAGLTLGMLSSTISIYLLS